VGATQSSLIWVLGRQNSPHHSLFVLYGVNHSLFKLSDRDKWHTAMRLMKLEYAKREKELYRGIGFLHDMDTLKNY